MHIFNKFFVISPSTMKGNKMTLDTSIYIAEWYVWSQTEFHPFFCG